MYQSILFTPGDRPELFKKSRSTGANLIILDLEDAVAPDSKDQAREAVMAYCSGISESVGVGVRVNAFGSPWHNADLTMLAKLKKLPVVMVPKAESVADLQELCRRLPQVSLIALIETARGVLAAQSLAQVPEVCQLAFGSVDFMLDCSIPGDEGNALLFARSMLVLASAAAGIAQPIDGVTLDIHDPALLISDIAEAKRLGFGGKLCIHPKQVALAKEGFSFSETEVEHAKGIITAAERVSKYGAIALNGKLIDRPVLERARRILAASSRA